MFALAVAAISACDEPANELLAGAPRRQRTAGTAQPSGGDAGGSTGGNDPDGSSSSGGPADGGPPSPERAIAARLGLPARFAIGLGNDAQGADANAASGFTLGPKVDIHYMYLSGLDWPSWTSLEGAYVTEYANAANSHGVVPMFTLYQAAAWGEGNLGAFNDVTFMTAYWRGVRVMFERLGELGSPAIVHLEPDLWGYAQQAKGDDPSKLPMKVGSLVPECAGKPETVAGFGKCIVALARALAPNVAVGLSASTFGAYDPSGKPDPVRVGAYLKKVGGDESDIVVVEALDRDAGCFEAAVDSKCKRTGTFYWDESNLKEPSFHSHLAWAKAIRLSVGKPLLWWQMPLGVPSSTPGGSAGHYRDNRVRYLFKHPDEFVDAGGIGAVFGAGAGNQTTVETDGNQFKDALTSYLASPSPLL
jgi:hypothetical protein